MPKCFSLTASRSWCYRTHFSNSGLRSTITDLGDGTVMHCWVPKARIDSKPDLVLVHGFGANAMWQWGDVVRLMVPHFNVYVPDLVFFGDSYTTRPDRSESFQVTTVWSFFRCLILHISIIKCLDFKIVLFATVFLLMPRCCF